MPLLVSVYEFLCSLKEVEEIKKMLLYNSKLNIFFFLWQKGLTSILKLHITEIDTYTRKIKRESIQVTSFSKQLLKRYSWVFHLCIEYCSISGGSSSIFLRDRIQSKQFALLTSSLSAWTLFSSAELESPFLFAIFFFSFSLSGILIRLLLSRVGYFRSYTPG